MEASVSRECFSRPASEKMPLLSVEKALLAILAEARGPLGVEDCALIHAFGRTLAKDVFALRTQPPRPLSSMDGYALRAVDSTEATLRLIGESAAGRGFAGEVGRGECVRIFTGAPIPAGADSVLMQEYSLRDGDSVKAITPVTPGQNIRATGLDFSEGERILEKGCRLTPADIALAASANHPTLSLARRPRVAVLATGDELVTPGSACGPDQIVASNNFAVIGMIEAAGGHAIDLGLAADNFSALESSVALARAENADVLVTIGGASVGDHDLVRCALTKEGMKLGFWRVSMKPGKPLIHGHLGPMTILGLPGNPVSAVVCGELFLKPLIRALCGDPSAGVDRSELVLAGAPLEPTGERQEFLRATLTNDDSGRSIATAQDNQDSSLTRVLARSQALILRAPRAPASEKGCEVRILRLTA